VRDLGTEDVDGAELLDLLSGLLLMYAAHARAQDAAA